MISKVSPTCPQSCDPWHGVLSLLYCGNYVEYHLGSICVCDWQAQKLLVNIVAFLLRPLQWLVTLAQKITGEQPQARQQSASA